jgi:HEAT repeat protein
MPNWVRTLLAPALLLGCVGTGSGADIQLWGRPIEYWFEKRLQVTMTDPQAVEAFMELGTNALPFLIKVLERKPSLLAEAADKMRNRYSPQPMAFAPGGRASPIVPPASVPEGNSVNPLGSKILDVVGSAQEVNERRICAARLIGDLGTNGAQVLPTLVKIWIDPTDDWGVKDMAGQALVAMGDEVAGYLPDFLDAAKSTNANMRCTSIMLIGHCGPKGRAAVPLLRDLVDHGDPWLAAEAARSLWKVDRQTNVALQVFSGFLANSANDWLGIKYLAEMGEAARPVIPALMTHLADTNPYVRLEVEALIRMLDPAFLTPMNARVRSGTAANVSNMIADFKSGNGATREHALMAIKMYGPDATPAIPALIDVLQRTDHFSYEPGYAADALAEIGPAASPAVPALIAAGRRGYSDAPITALGRIGPDAKGAIPFLEGELKSKVPYVRWRAADSITRIAPQNASAVISVFHELEHLPPRDVWSPDAKPGDRPIARSPDPSSNYLRLAAEVSLWRLGLVEKPPVPEILAEMDHPKPMGIGTKSWIQLLCDIGPDAKAALPALEKCLAPYAYPHREAAIAIRRIDPKEADRLNLPGLLALP